MYLCVIGNIEVRFFEQFISKRTSERNKIRGFLSWSEQATVFSRTDWTQLCHVADYIMLNLQASTFSNLLNKSSTMHRRRLTFTSLYATVLVVCLQSYEELVPWDYSAATETNALLSISIGQLFWD